MHIKIIARFDLGLTSKPLIMSFTGLVFRTLFLIYKSKNYGGKDHCMS